jgi:multidrug efflux pump subunit AcrA (membrane-fusion protein)
MATMFPTKHKLGIALVLLVGVIGAGVLVQVAFAASAAARRADDDPAKKRQPAADERKKGPRPLQVPAQRDGILVFVGTEVKKADDKDGKTHRPLAIGDTVEEGQLLARIDDQLARLEVDLTSAKLRAAEADHQAAESLAKEADARLQRLTDIRPQQRVPFEEFSAATLTATKYRLEATSKHEVVKAINIEQQRAQIILRQHEIRSPIQGVIRNILKQRGEAVRAFETVFEIEVRAGK